MDPTIAVKTPAMAGNPEAREIPKHKGRAIKNTSNPDTKSYRKYLVNPAKLPEGISSVRFAGSLVLWSDIGGAL
jgi:hypothetical protein